MDRLRAAAAGLAVVVVVSGGFVLARTLTRLLWASIQFAETVGMGLFVVLLGYLAYRIFWGVSDDPRRH
jgi:predicted membrane-bound dolichyl-phosphate-mannose-protein mannosyltransferase